MSVATIFEGWNRIQLHLVRRASELRPEELQLRSSAQSWPVWAIVSHIATARIYWLCGVFKETGAEQTPFADPFGEGWEDRLDVPRQSGELMLAVESSWGIVESCLQRWTTEMLGETFTREIAGEVQHHSRQSVLTRLATHDAFHCGEISILLDANGFASLDPWSPVA
jgi:uncharacterized damage-inducible protein DinB